MKSLILAILRSPSGKKRCKLIKTASFFELQNYTLFGRLVSISMTMPAGQAHHFINERLFPDWDLVNGFKAKTISEIEYRKRYLFLIEERIGGIMYDLKKGYLGPEKTLEVLDIEDEDTLLCWEHFGNFCHRIIVADLLEKNRIEVDRK